MSEGNFSNVIDLAEYQVQPREIDHGLIIVYGAMRCNKTTLALEYARELDEERNVMAFRPTQDPRHANDQIESQNPHAEPFPAMRTPSLAPLLGWDADVVVADEPHFWEDPKHEGRPHEASFQALVSVLFKERGLVVVSTLDKNYMAQEFEWFSRLRSVGEELGKIDLGFQMVQVKGYCELCPRDDLGAIKPSEFTNLYLHGVKQHEGSPVIGEEDKDKQVFIPCCADCVNAEINERLADDYEPLSEFLKAA